MEEQIRQIRRSYLEKIQNAQSLKDLDDIYLSLFGKNGEINLLPKQFSRSSKEELKNIGPLFNKVKDELESEINNKRHQIKEHGYQSLTQENFDLEKRLQLAPRSGKIHPLIKLENEIAELFKKLGFQQFAAPHIDTDFNNFEVLHIPQDHPARDLWDTLYVDQENTSDQSGKLLLRTHTSNSQIHIMKVFKPPIRLMNIDRAFRYENLDARHEHTFEQFELVYIDKGLNMGNLQYLSEYLLKNIFGENIKVRLKPKYYPFVEPGAGVEGECIFCQGKGCKICGGRGWLELAGAGMIHPEVLRNGGINPDEYSGIAWGFGPDRVAMLKYGVNDTRAFKSGKLKDLEVAYESK